MPTGADSLRERLSRALPAAMKARDRPAINALRSALAAIDNAGAVDPAQASPDTAHPAPTASAGQPDPASAGESDPEATGAGEGSPGPAGAAGEGPTVAGSVAGLGATEVERRRLSEAQMEEIIRAEVLERERAAAGYERAGQLELAERLRGEANVLSAYLETT
jgi:uncharacterized protein YqeY